MATYKLTPDQRAILEALASGAKLAIQFPAPTLQRLLRRSLVRMCNHPTVRGPGGVPALAVELVANSAAPESPEP